MTTTEALGTTGPIQGSLFGWPGGDAWTAGEAGLCAIGVPTDHGNGISRGAARGPRAVRLASAGVAPPKVGGFDLGDATRADFRNPDRLTRLFADIFGWMRGRDLSPLILGGDHSITYAAVCAMQEARELCLVWFDAHTDFSPWTPGEPHDHKQVLRRTATLAGVARIVQIGYRGITAGDERCLGAEAVVVTTGDARRLDAAALLDLIPAGLPCYISIDVDVIDPFYAPGTSAPVPDGLLPYQVADLLGALVVNREVVGVDLVEVNPVFDGDARTSLVAAELLRSVADRWPHQQVYATRKAAFSAGSDPGACLSRGGPHRASSRRS